MSNKKSARIDFGKETILPIIKDQRDITFGTLQYVESVVGALLEAKKSNGPAWKTGSRLVDVTVTGNRHVHLELKVHGINLETPDGGHVLNRPDIIKFEY